MLIEPARAGLYRKEIAYSRETKDYAMRLNGELVGYARTSHEAEVALDWLVSDLMSGQRFKRKPHAPILSSLPIWPQLLCLKRQHDALKEDSQHVAARTVKEQALGLVEQWFDGTDEDWLSGADRLDLLASARAHVSATQARWNGEIAEGAPF